MDPAEAEEAEKDGYALDAATFDEDPEIPEVIGPVQYFGVAQVEGVPIFSSPESQEEVDRLLPGEVMGAELPSGGDYARLLDGRGWIRVGVGSGLEEVHPWAARVLKKPGVSKDDAAALAYLSLDQDKMSALTNHLPLPQRVLNELGKRGVKNASPIQEAVFRDIHKGQSLCLQSQTGSGKTLAMTLPMLTAMAEESEWGEKGDKIVIVTSCRELAVQLFADIDSLGFFPKGKGFATMVIVGNVPPTEAVMKANVIIGTPNELGGVLHKDNDIISNMNNKLRAIILDEVDAYTTAPHLTASTWNIKKKRRIYNEQKQLMSGRLGDFNTGAIEWFLKRALAYSRRRDLQVLAASATLSKNMARKVYRMLRFDPLGRWYNNAPLLMRPRAAMEADWQAIPRMPTIPLKIKHRYVQVVRAPTDVKVENRHYTRKMYQHGGLKRLKIRAAAGQQRNVLEMGGHPIAAKTAASLMDGLHDALKSRKPGSAMLIICRTAGMTVRDTVEQLHDWGFHEAEAMHESLWTDPEDWPSRWAIKYSYDQRDHASELAGKHQELQERTGSGIPKAQPAGSDAWKDMEARTALGEATSPLVVGFEGIGRGLHLEGIETVYILGLPRKPETYLHLAGRVGRLGQRAGKVVSIIPKRSSKVLDSWASQIGPGIRFKKEPILRIRSAKVTQDGVPRMLTPDERKAEFDRQEKRALQKRQLQAPPERPLPEPQAYMVPGFDDKDKSAYLDKYDWEMEPVPVELPQRDRVMDKARVTRQRSSVAGRQLAAQMQRSTNSWPGPPKTPKFVPQWEVKKAEKAEKRRQQQ